MRRFWVWAVRKNRVERERRLIGVFGERVDAL